MNLVGVIDCRVGIFKQKHLFGILSFFCLKDMKQNKTPLFNDSRPNVETGPAEAQRELVEPELFGATEWMVGQLEVAWMPFFPIGFVFFFQF